MTRSANHDDEPGEAAIGWMVELCSGVTSERQKRAFESWLAADSRHVEAWAQLQRGLAPCGLAAEQKLPAGRLRQQLVERRSDRRAVLAGLMAALGLGTAGAVVTDRFVPLGSLLADHVTRTAEQTRVHLDDGSVVVMAPRTALDIAYAPGRRGIRLIEGEVLLLVASRAAPFRFDAGALRLTATSGRFLIEKRPDSLAATGLEGTGQIAFATQASGPIGRGERIGLRAGQPDRQPVEVEDAAAWLDGLLVAKNRPVAAIVDGLRPYFPGVIRLDPAVAEIRATGVFPLRRPDDALDILGASLNLSVTRVAHYWVAIGPGAPGDARPG
ncbi:DUF4880 domain-containing protein [Methylobacterium sp. GC_Met_2]|uniref:FecR family protein n=1 Tax=Methylobacterium sp. GC_Met_2 TaxID=2937376 RepID=UPI00226BB0DC|nr:DUF4880 domain-containing protein [Methylobacterium sp. GC_Met_2]